MEMVERKVREDTFTKIEEEIRQRRKELRELKNEYEAVKSALQSASIVEEPEPDDIPFDQMTQAQLDEVNKNS